MRRGTRGGLEMNLALSLSYDYGTGLTCGIILAPSELQGAYIKVKLTELPDLASHPLLLPTLITGFIRSFLDDKIDELWKEMVTLETKGGFTKWELPFQEQFDRPDYKDISRDVFGVIQSLTIWQRHAEELLLLIESIRESNNYLSDMNVAISQRKAFRDIGKILEERLNFIAGKGKLMLVLIRSIEKRTEAHMNAVRHLLLFPICITIDVH